MTVKAPINMRRQGGQVLPLALSLAALGVLSVVVLYNVGQTVAARVRLTHVADAAAYSGALVQARALNLLAYINRAQVAHQVAMAHLVTLATWVQFGQTERQRLLQGNPPAALMGLLFGPKHGSAYASSVAAPHAASMLQDFMHAYTRHDEVVHQVLARAAQATVASLPLSRQQAMQAVVQANYPEFAMPTVGENLRGGRDDRLVMQIVEDDWPGFVQSYRDDAFGGGRRYAEENSGGIFRSLILQAAQRYDFLAPRQGTARNTWSVNWRCPWRRHELRRRGETTLQTNGTWESSDTQSFHKVRSNAYIGCYYREYGMGWGKVSGASSDAHMHQAVSGEAPRDFSKQHFWRWVQQHTRWDIAQGTTNALASAYAMQAQKRWQGHGLPAYVEVPAQHASRSARSARFVLSLQQPASLLSTTGARSTVATPTGRFLYRGLQAHEKVVATSAAEVYFVRPTPRPDGEIELATLFRPYWHARLTAVSSASPLH